MAEAAAVEAEIGKLGTCNWSDGADVVTGVVAVEVAEPDSVEVRGWKRNIIMQRLKYFANISGNLFTGCG